MLHSVQPNNTVRQKQTMTLRDHIDLDAISTINLSGRGGKEVLVGSLLPGWSRVSEALYDYTKTSHCLRAEIKKQANLQWFDVGKYHDISDSDRGIWMIFINHEDGYISSILACTLGKFCDSLLSTPRYQKLGWHQDVFSVAHKFKRDFPALQFKVKAEILRVERDFPTLFDVLYKK